MTKAIIAMIILLVILMSAAIFSFIMLLTDEGISTTTTYQPQTTLLTTTLATTTSTTPTTITTTTTVKPQWVSIVGLAPLGKVELWIEKDNFNTDKYETEPVNDNYLIDFDILCLDDEPKYSVYGQISVVHLSKSPTGYNVNRSISYPKDGYCLTGQMYVER